jgi:hypothetical protein
MDNGGANERALIPHAAIRDVAQPIRSPTSRTDYLRARGWIILRSIRERGSSYPLRLYVGKHHWITN